jgi:signal transduction histidine kinase
MSLLGASQFPLGFLFGFAVCLALAAVAGLYVYRRFILLERRTRHAERLAELGTLTGGLAHEIKNPLSTVQLNLQLLAEDITPDNPAHPRIATRLSVVQRETTRLRAILDDFLRYAGKLEVERQPTDLNDLLQDLYDFFTPQAQLQKVRLRLRTTPAPLTAPVDPKLIKQAVLNLMLNALQAMPEGGELILGTNCDHDDHRACIHVTDTGKGIPEKDVGKIFQAYYSTKKGGTGLGLAMAHRIVQEHGGQITVNSELGKGTDFTLRLPLK